MAIQEFKLVVCGCGPAGISPLVYLEEHQMLDNLLKEGICLIDPSQHIGGGEINKYRVTANSLGKVFLEIFKNESSPLLIYLKEKSSYHELQHHCDTAPPLKVIGRFLSDIGVYLKEKVESGEKSDFLHARVTQIVVREDGRYLINTEGKDGNKQVIAEQVLFNIGGVQEKLDLQQYQMGWLSSDFIKGVYDDQIQTLLRRIDRKLKVIILGSSHSAFSCIARLKQFELQSSSIDLRLIYRQPVRLFYNSTKEADLDGYLYDPVSDVCPLSGRVNRYSGLRYDSFILGRDVLKGVYTNIEMCSLNSLSEVEYSNLIVKADIVLMCTGYHENMVEMVDDNGEKIVFARQGRVVVTNDSCNPLKMDGEHLKHFYMYGLGSGLRTNALNGGESSYQGRIDGVWFYQHEVTPRIIPSLLQFI